eukprot:scaffold48_cov311-Pinguiococcus_pyrenoidosus.AAC.61
MNQISPKTGGKISSKCSLAHRLEFARLCKPLFFLSCSSSFRKPSCLGHCRKKPLSLLASSNDTGCGGVPVVQIRVCVRVLPRPCVRNLASPLVHPVGLSCRLVKPFIPWRSLPSQVGVLLPPIHLFFARRKRFFRGRSRVRRLFPVLDNQEPLVGNALLQVLRLGQEAWVARRVCEVPQKRRELTLGEEQPLKRELPQWGKEDGPQSEVQVALKSQARHAVVRSIVAVPIPPRTIHDDLLGAIEAFADEMSIVDTDPVSGLQVAAYVDAHDAPQSALLQSDDARKADSAETGLVHKLIIFILHDVEASLRVLLLVRLGHEALVRTDVSASRLPPGREDCFQDPLLSCV